MDKKISSEIARLRTEIEGASGREMRTPKDFQYLRQCIGDRIRIWLGITTLKRVWEYIPQGNLRASTLSVLANYLGYASWEKFTAGEKSGGGSGFVGAARLAPGETLAAGSLLRLSWEPGRVCQARHLGNGSFEIIAVENTHLLVGDKFRCHVMIAGEHLILDMLERGGKSLPPYVCGRLSGVDFEIVDEE